MKMLIKLILLLFLVIIGLIAAGLWRSGAPLTEPPGPMERINTYLTSNVAETSSHSVYPELRERYYKLPPDDMLNRAQQAIHSLGWKITSVDPRQRIVRAVVTSELFGFEDDFSVTIHPRQNQSSRLAIRSASRVGKADLGANTGHILQFIHTLEQVMPATALVIQ